MARLLEGKPLAEKIRQEVIGRVAALNAKGVGVRLAALQVGENPASAVYVRSQAKYCRAVGIDYNLVTLPGDVSAAELFDRIVSLNNNPSVNAIILQLPLPGHLDERQFQSLVAPEKDVEGVNPSNIGRLLLGRPSFVPCTAAGVMELIRSTGVELRGRRVVVVGHSAIIGKPISFLLLEELATVSICHIGTGERGDLPDFVRRAEILVVAVGKAGLVRGEWVPEGSLVVDVGINRVEGRLVGDVEFEAAAERAAWITPVPGGVGPLTSAMLLRNAVNAVSTEF